jgi:ketosteroid isomerase-like protein
MSTQEDVAQLIALVVDGNFLEAIEKFYAEDATMQENNGPPRVGLAALLENERRALAYMSQLRPQALSNIVNGDRAAIHWIFDFVDPQGVGHRIDEVAYQQWRDGKIVQERFFYDPAQRTTPVTP